MKYLIHGADYNPNSGGVMVLHKLAHELSKLNDETYIMCNTLNPMYNAKKISFEDSFGLSLQDDCVVIYPEVIFGNPLNAKNVVRWVLYYPGVLAGSKEYDENENIFLFHREYGLNSRYSNCPILNIFESNTQNFYDAGMDRSGSCFLLKKGIYKHSPTNLLNGFYIDRFLTGENTNEILFDLFNKFERFISYDSNTYYSIIAAMCGCDSIVIRDENIEAEDFYKNEFVKYGVSYGFDDIDRTKSTKHLVKDHIDKLYGHSLNTVLSFHEYCLNNFNGNKI